MLVCPWFKGRSISDILQGIDQEQARSRNLWENLANDWISKRALDSSYKMEGGMIDV